MGNTETNKNTRNYDYSSIRVKGKTKEDVNKFLDKVNKTEDCGKVTFDAFITYFLANATKEDIEKLQLQVTTWEHEEKRLRRIWEKKKGKVNNNKWKEMLYLGQLSDFISENSRLKVA
ncbi:MAG: hypothetical protein GY909_17360 [Oligoflexia bacterium]|jgi:hypothetical protein|nr:hypothetical protein [Bacteroidota bacterium]MCP4914890.1 hypothetical protein [Oligoflexia bacterium]